MAIFFLRPKQSMLQNEEEKRHVTETTYPANKEMGLRNTFLRFGIETFLAPE